jgi:hypothetical protein
MENTIPEIAILLQESLVFLKDLWELCSILQPQKDKIKLLYLGVHDVGRYVCICDVLAELAAQLRLDLLEVQRFQGGTRTSIDLLFISDNAGAQGLRESSHRLSKIALEELNNGRREVKMFGTLQHLLLGKGVRCHPLSKIANDFRRRCDLFTRMYQ